MGRGHRQGGVTPRARRWEAGGAFDRRARELEKEFTKGVAGRDRGRREGRRGAANSREGDYTWEREVTPGHGTDSGDQTEILPETVCYLFSYSLEEDKTRLTRWKSRSEKRNVEPFVAGAGESEAEIHRNFGDQRKYRRKNAMLRQFSRGKRQNSGGKPGMSAPRKNACRGSLGCCVGESAGGGGGTRRQRTPPLRCAHLQQRVPPGDGCPSRPGPGEGANERGLTSPGFPRRKAECCGEQSPAMDT